MAKNEQQALDKATAKMADELAKVLDAAHTEIVTCADAKLEAELRREHAAFVAKLDAARKLPADKAPAAVRALAKSIRAFGVSAEKRSDAATDRQLRVDAHQKLKVKLAEAMLAVGKIGDPVLAKPLIAAQLRHRANANRIEALKDDWKAFREIEAALPTLDALLAVVQQAQGMNAWIRATYQPAAARATAAARSVGEDHCRKNLIAQVQTIEAERVKALAAGDIDRAKGKPLAALRQVEVMAARVRATGPAIDREFDRLETLIRKAGKTTTSGETLRSLRMHKAGGWPKSAATDEMDREVTAFEKALARFAAMVEKEAAAAKTAKA